MLKQEQKIKELEAKKRKAEEDYLKIKEKDDLRKSIEELQRREAELIKNTN